MCSIWPSRCRNPCAEASRDRGRGSVVSASEKENRNRLGYMPRYAQDVHRRDRGTQRLRDRDVARR